MSLKTKAQRDLKHPNVNGQATVCFTDGCHSGSSSMTFSGSVLLEGPVGATGSRYVRVGADLEAAKAGGSEIRALIRILLSRSLNFQLGLHG